MKSITQMLDLKGRKAVITGGTGYIGRTIAHTLSELGCETLLVDLPGSDYTKVVSEIEHDWHEACRFFACDLEIQESRNQLVDFINTEIGALDIVVHNAAFAGDSKLSGWAKPFDGQTTETWRRALEVNMTAVFDLSRELAPLLKKSNDGVILNIGSIYGVSAPDYSLYKGTKMANPAAYSASKGGLLQLTRWLATTLAPDVRVNAISPGGVYRQQPQEFVERYTARTPLGRMAVEEDFKGSVAYLLSGMSTYVTGQNLLVDGGWTLW